MMDCKTATALMSQGMDRPLETAERVNLKVHTMMCSGCRNYRNQLQVLRDAARQMAHGMTPADDDADDAQAGPQSKPPL